MNFFNFFQTKRKNRIYNQLLNNQLPLFSQFGNNIMMSDVVVQAIRCIATEISKLEPRHIRETNNGRVHVQSNIQRMLYYPNFLMTRRDFLEKIVFQLFANSNCFILPTYDLTKDSNGRYKKIFKDLWVLNPITVQFIENEGNGLLYLQFTFENGIISDPILYTDIIHIRQDFSVNDYLGGNSNGQPNNKALLETLKINHVLLQGVEKYLQYNLGISGFFRFNSIVDYDFAVKTVKDLEQKIKVGGVAFAPLDQKADFIPIPKTGATPHKDILQFIEEKILRHFGVPLKILNGEYTKEEYEAFYQKTLEPIIISLSQAFTKTLFTYSEITHGNQIYFYAKDLLFMSIDQKIEMIRLLGDSGALYENEKREIFGLSPIEDLEGIRRQSLNYVNVEIANTYQLEDKGKGGEKIERVTGNVEIDERATDTV